jgi:hypothetical protein
MQVFREPTPESHILSLALWTLTSATDELRRKIKLNAPTEHELVCSPLPPSIRPDAPYIHDLHNDDDDTS